MSRKALNTFARSRLHAADKSSVVREANASKLKARRESVEKGARVVVRAADRLGSALTSGSSGVSKNVYPKKKFNKRAASFVKRNKGVKLKW